MLSAMCQQIKQHAVKGEAHSEQIGLKRDPEHVSRGFFEKSGILHSLGVSYCAVLHKTGAVAQKR